MKRILSVLLLCALILSAVPACGESTTASDGSDANSGAGQSQSADPSPGEEEKAETEADVLAPYRSIDLGGRTVHISVSSNISENGGGMPSSYPYIAGPDELTGESVQDNVYERNHLVEEALSVKLDYQPLDLNYDQVQPYIANLVVSGDTSVDCYVNDQLGLLNCAMNGYLLDLADKANFADYWFDFDSGAYYADYMKNLSLGSQRFLMTGDYFIDTLRAAHVLYLNKNICAEVAGTQDAVYSMVLEGSWTLDRFNELVESAYSDANGNSTADDEDRYGLSGHSKGWSAPYYTFYYSTDSHVVDFDDAGMPYINEANVERMSVVSEKLIKLDSSVGMFKTSSVAESLKKFVDGQSMFTMFQKVGDIEQGSIRDFDGMGVVPYPKLDESQAAYRTLVHDTAELGAVPATTVGEAASAVSAVIQVMATHAHAYLLNDYYEVALKNKYAQDKTSAQMLDMVVAGISAPFEFAYELGFGDASYLAGISWNPVGDSITQSTDVTASTFQRYLKTANKKLAKLIAAYGG
ncbi:MAG: hypothetical protein E7576_17220 [Ruminococcaceae bacterium]|jgi:hypothetical protein|nr:hypothetical protein [Oscillospiraceae bacterium]